MGSNNINISNVPNPSNMNKQLTVPSKEESIEHSIENSIDDKTDDEEDKNDAAERSSDVQRNINALQLALQSPRNQTHSTNSMIFASTPRSSSTPRSNSLRKSELIIFPKSVPKSAIIYGNELEFLLNIPGVSVPPQRGRGMTVDDDVVSKSTLIRHVKSKSSQMTVVWQQKRSSTLLKKTDLNQLKDRNEQKRESEMGLIEKKTSPKSKQPKLNKKKQKSVVLNRSEGELIEEWKIRGYMLYYKYVAVSAEYEINIDYGTRNRLILQMNDINALLKNQDIDLKVLSESFDSCIHQMYQFCNFSMGRFKQSNDFETLVRCFRIKTQPPNTP